MPGLLSATRFHIRAARETDLPLVATFPQTPAELFYVHPSARFPLTAEQLLPNFLNRSGNSVVEVAGRVAAFANYISVTAQGDAIIGNVVVDPAQRGTGVGRALLEYLMQRAVDEHDCCRALIPCFNENTQGLLFYLRLGFEPLRYETRTDPQGQVVVLFYLQRALDSAGKRPHVR